MSRRACCICMALLLAVSASAIAQQVQWLRYREKDSRDRTVLARLMTTAQTETPRGVARPQFTSPRPLFAKWVTPMVPAGHVWLAFDGSTKDGPYDRLYIDADCDGRLDDETPAKAYRVSASSSNSYTYFGEVKVLLPGEDGPVAYHLNVTFSFRSAGPARLYIYSAGWYEGSVDVGGRSYGCKLVDHNVNGAFSDSSIDFDQADRIQIDGDVLNAPRHVGKYIQLEGKLYRPEVARDGAHVRFTPAGDVPTGTVSVPGEVSEINFGGPNGLLCFHPDDGKAALPAGRYRIYSWKMQRTDESGARWEARAYGFGEKGTFEVTAGRAMELAVGEPFAASITESVSGSSRNLNRELKSPLGGSLQLLRNGQTPSAPQLRIRSADGSYDRTFPLRYG